MKKWLSIFILTIGMFSTLSLFAMPLGEIKIHGVKKHNGQYVYLIQLKNLGPIADGVTTPSRHQVWDPAGQPHPAGNKYLTDDKNLVVFGIDTLQDDIEIATINNGIIVRKTDSGAITLPSSFHGRAEPGFDDSDDNGIPNQVVAWHLPFFGWDLNDTIQVGDKIKKVIFTANKKLDHVNVWIGGSDDANIWNDNHVMAEDAFGIYDATDQQYLATFLTRKVTVRFHDDDH